MTYSYIRWTDEEIKEMAKLYDGGMSLEEVGAEYGISKQRVKQLFKKFSIECRKQTVSKKILEGNRERKKILPKDALEKLYVEQGKAIVEICTELNTNIYVIYQSLYFHGIPKRSETDFTKSILTKDLLKKLYLDEQMTANEIAASLGFAPVTVKQKLWELQIKKR